MTGSSSLPADAPVGASFADYAGLDDAVFDVAITPNRQDCMGVRGIARDLAAAGLGTLKPLDVPAIEGSFDNPVEIRIEDPDGCPAFYGRTVRGRDQRRQPRVDAAAAARRRGSGRSRRWSTSPITSCSTSAGRPTPMTSPSSTARSSRAARRDGETVLALNEKEYALDPSMTVIADDARSTTSAGSWAASIAGSREATTDVLLEVAYFTPERIAQTGQALALTSDARTPLRARGRPGVPRRRAGDADRADPRHLRRRGEPRSRAPATPPVEAKRVAFDPALTLALGGIDVPAERQRDDPRPRSASRSRAARWSCRRWRRDVDGPADLVEEVARIVGYDAGPVDPAAARRRRRPADRDARAD